MNREEVIRVYDLAHLEPKESEIDMLTDKYNTILDFAKIIMEVDTEGVEYMEMVPSEYSELRDDTPEESLDRETALENATDREYGYFRLKKVL